MQLTARCRGYTKHRTWEGLVLGNWGLRTHPANVYPWLPCKTKRNQADAGESVTHQSPFRQGEQASQRWGGAGPAPAAPPGEGEGGAQSGLPPLCGCPEHGPSETMLSSGKGAMGEFAARLSSPTPGSAHPLPANAPPTSPDHLAPSRSRFLSSWPLLLETGLWVIT